MASGLPVIATKVGGNIESVQDGVTGFLTPPQDADAIAEKAILLMRNPQLASSFGIAGSRVVASKFTIQSNAQNTIALYRKILEKRRLS
jgi:glycosyltransferase involved in cell wall biosynthesis